jgi:hypothetical protein
MKEWKVHFGSSEKIIFLSSVILCSKTSELFLSKPKKYE